MEKHKAIRSIRRSPNHGKLMVDLDPDEVPANDDQGHLFGSINDSCEIAKKRVQKYGTQEVGNSDEPMERNVSPLDAAVLERVGIHNSTLYFEIMEAVKEFYSEELPLSEVNAAILERIGSHHLMFFNEVRKAMADLHPLFTPQAYVNEEGSSDDDDEEDDEGEEEEEDDDNDDEGPEVVDCFHTISGPEVVGSCGTDIHSVKSKVGDDVAEADPFFEKNKVECSNPFSEASTCPNVFAACEAPNGHLLAEIPFVSNSIVLPVQVHMGPFKVSSKDDGNAEYHLNNKTLLNNGKEIAHGSCLVVSSGADSNGGACLKSKVAATMSKHAAGLVFDNDTFVLSCDSKDDARKSTLAAGSLVGPLNLDGESKSNGSFIDKLDSRKLASADSICQRGAHDGLGKELPISDTNANITNKVGSNVPTYAHPPCVVHVAGPLGGSPSLGFTDEMVSNGNTTILVGSKIPTQAHNPCLAQAVGPYCGSPNRDISLIGFKPTANLLQIAPKAQGRGHEHKVTKQPTLAYQPALVASNVAASCGLDNKKIFVDLFKPQVAPSASLAVDLNHAISDQGLTPSEATDPREEFKLHHVPHGPRNNEKKLHIPKELATKGSKILESSLVGHFIGRKLPFSLVSNATSRLWGGLGLVDMRATESGVYFFKFSDVDARDAVLEGGPWYIAGRPIILRQWKQNLKLDSQGVKSIPIWVNMHNIPLEYWNPEGISYIASFLGKPIHVDRVTASGRRISFARVCIEVYAEDDLIHDFDIEAEGELGEEPYVTRIRVEYQWSPIRCAKCKVFGHNCSSARNQPYLPKNNGGVWKAAPARVKSDTKEEVTVLASSGKLEECPSSSTRLPQLVEDSIVTTITSTKSIPYLSTASRAKNEASPVTPLNNRFHALPSEEEAGVDLGHAEENQDTFPKFDCVDDADDLNIDIASASSDATSPPSSRQRKKNSKTKHSGSRPKGRHKY